IRITRARRASSARILRLRTRRSSSARSSVVNVSAIWRQTVPVLLQSVQATSGTYELRHADAEAMLNELGWSEALDAAFTAWRGKPGHEAGRVVVEFNHLYRVSLDDGDV